MYVIITRDKCEFCDKAKALLRSRGQHFMVYNIQTVSSRWIVPLLLMADLKTVPQIFDKEGKHIGGYAELKDSLQ